MILVFGKTGQVATELQRHGAVTALGRQDADLRNPEACVAAIRAYAPKAVINAAAYTAVDQAEDEEALATIINGAAPTAMAVACAELDIPFIQISTDYVFDGKSAVPYDTDAATAPLGAYGRSKLLGEGGIRAAGGRHIILRTSWVFSPHGNNFVKTMIRLGMTRDKISVVSDQIGGPTAARDIATVCSEMARQLVADANKSGTYHFSGAEDVSWADFAQEIFNQCNMDCEVIKILSSDFPTRSKRPASSRLNCVELAVFDLQRPEWRISLNSVLRELDQI